MLREFSAVVNSQGRVQEETETAGQTTQGIQEKAQASKWQETLAQTHVPFHTFRPLLATRKPRWNA